MQFIHWRSSHYAVTHVRNKNGNIQVRPPKVVKVIFHTIPYGTALKGKNSPPSGSKFFPSKRSSHFEKGRN